jgi:hypothetical protein
MGRVPTAKAVTESQSFDSQGENKMNSPNAARRPNSRPIDAIGNPVQ